MYWQHFRDEPGGTRFQARYHRRAGRKRGPLMRSLLLGLGLLLLAAGLAMLVLPGPGLLVMLLGGALVAEESLLAAVVLDRCEVGVRRLLRRRSRRDAREGGAPEGEG